MNSTPTSRNDASESTDDAAATDRAHPSERTREGGPDEAWAAIVARWDELREYVGYYIAANVDRLRLSGRATLMWSVLGMITGFVAVSVVAAAGVMFVVGLSAGVGMLLGGRMWLGQLVVGATILLAAIGGGWLVIRHNLQKYHRTLVQKYEHRKEEERTEYGTDVAQRAEQRSRNA